MIKRKFQICIECGKPQWIKALKRCQWCYDNFSKARRAKKNKVRNGEYKKAREEFFEELASKEKYKVPKCQIRVNGCTDIATQVHHSVGRLGARLADKSGFVGACDNCHHWAEEHPLEAKEMGVSKSRLQTT